MRRRLAILLAAMVAAFALVGGVALAEPDTETGTTPPSDGQIGSVAEEVDRSQAPQQGQTERGVDYDTEGNPYVAGELLVTYEEQVSTRTSDAASQDAGAEVEAELPEIDAAALSFPEVKEKGDRREREEALETKKQELQQDQAVESVSYNYLLQTQSDDQFYEYQWGLRRIRAPLAWPVTRGAPAKIAIVDSGIHNNHPDLAGRVIFERDYVQDDAVAQPTDFHATHLAGIAAARTDNGKGIAGTAPKARLMDYKVVGPRGATFADASQAIIDAAKARADVINLSLGSPNTAPVLKNAVNFAWNLGAVVVASAGNDFQNGNPLNYPAAYPRAVAVSAVNRANTHSNYSNARSYVDVAAPGGSTTFGTDPFQDSILGPVPTSFAPNCAGNPDCYDFHAGTSQAAAFVSGVAALVDSRGLTNVQVRRRIEATVTDLGPVGRDNTYGYGLVNAQAAVGR